MSIWLFSAIEIALFWLIIWLFEAVADRSAPGKAEPHFVYGRRACKGCRAVYRSSNHKSISKKYFARYERSLDYKHSFKLAVKSFLEAFLDASRFYQKCR